MMQNQSEQILNNEICLKNIDFSYDHRHYVLKNLTFSAKAGKVLGLLGNNGAGKTTIFKLLAGLLRPESGKMTVCGFDPNLDPIKVRQISAFLPDEPLLYPCLSALENMAAFAILWGVPTDLAKERTENLLKQVDLWPVRHQWTQSYSKGMKQKLAICTAILHQAQIMLMDEPFNGLDIDAVLWAREMIDEFTSTGGTIILTSHTPEIIEAIADEVVILQNGNIAMNASNEVIKNQGGLLNIYKGLTQNAMA